MTDAQVLQIVSGAMALAAKLALPALLTTLVIGTLVSIVQTVTQIQEQTLSFVPKLIGVALIALLGGNWMIAETVVWVRELWSAIPTML
jgi:flagellar biosynthesis protein FliQ